MSAKVVAGSMNQRCDRSCLTVRRELRDCVESIGLRMEFSEASDHNEMKISMSPLLKIGPPPIRRGRRIRKERGPIDQHHWLPRNTDIIFREQHRLDVLDESKVVFWSMTLREQNICVFAIPSAGPIFICPAE